MSKPVRFETVRAKAGAILLDLLQPGWAARINVQRLKLNDCDSCVLGQLFGRYSVGAEQVFAMRLKEHTTEGGSVNCTRRDEIASEAGFYVTEADVNDEGYGSVIKAYTNLTAAWRREIAKRINV